MWTPRSVREEHVAAPASGLLPRTLEMARKAAAAYGVEPRFPFADRHLAASCLALPPTQRYRDGWTRVIARRALRDLLPAEVAARYGKANLAPNFERGLREHAPEALHVLAFERLPVAAPYLQVTALQEATRQFLRQEHDHATPLLIWRALMLTRLLDREQERGAERERQEPAALERPPPLCAAPRPRPTQAQIASA